MPIWYLLKVPSTGRTRMRSFSSNHVKTSYQLQESIRPADPGDVVTRIQDHHATCTNIGAPIEPDGDEAAENLDPLNALRVVFTSLPSWSVSYRGVPYDDARLIDGVWWYSPIAGASILRFPIQDHVTPLFENPPLKAYGTAS
jgi:hypothetical protein